MSHENLHELIALEIANNADEYRVRKGCATDVIRRCLAAQVSITSTGEIVAPGGRPLLEFVQTMRDGDGAHLFASPPPPPEAARPDFGAMRPGDRLEMFHRLAMNRQPKRGTTPGEGGAQ